MRLFSGKWGWGAMDKGFKLVGAYRGVLVANKCFLINAFDRLNGEGVLIIRIMQREAVTPQN